MKTTLKDRIHMYIFLLVTYIGTSSFIYSSANADLEICKYNPEFAYESIYITTAAGI